MTGHRQLSGPNRGHWHDCAVHTGALCDRGCLDPATLDLELELDHEPDPGLGTWLWPVLTTALLLAPWAVLAAVLWLADGR